jgi:hypothetical protein
MRAPLEQPPPMQRRYALRFENGERRGEVVDLEGGGATLGRRPGSTVQILDASVSGRHAELAIDERGVLLRDLGSTNGTRVGAERISERRLAHGDHVLVGNVRFLFIDRQVDADPPLTESDVDVAGIVGSAEAAGDAVHTISAQKVAAARSPRRSAFVLLLGLVVVAGAAAGGWLWWQGRAGGEAGSVAGSAVVPVEGNLLDGSYSFEGGAAGWEAQADGPETFGSDAGAARSGRAGLGAELADAQTWALHRSPPVRLPRGRALRATAYLRASGGARGSLGLELESESGAAAPAIAWSRPLEPDSNGDFEELTVAASAPPIYDRARVVLLARGGAEPGNVEADDVSLVPDAAAKAPPTLNEHQLFLLGEPPGAALLFKIDRALISGLSATPAAAPAGPALERATLSAQAAANGMRLAFAALPGAGEATLALRVEPALAEGGLATMGEGGYRTHQEAFEREGVQSVLAGSGNDLLRLSFPAPVRLSGRPQEGGFELRARLALPAEPFLQLSFLEELDAAKTLAREASDLEKRGERGRALARWSELLDRYPFETALVREAGEQHARLVEKGLAEVRRLHGALEEARFFRLVDLYRKTRGEAQALAQLYAQTEVEAGALELVATIDAELAALDADLRKAEKERLSAILSTLEGRGMDQLAQRVRDYLQERF